MPMKTSKAPATKSNVRKEKVPKLKANQLRIIQYLLSAASYVSVLQSPPMRGVQTKQKIVRYDFMTVKHYFEEFTMVMFYLKLHRYYHGDGVCCVRGYCFSLSVFRFHIPRIASSYSNIDSYTNLDS